MILSAKKDFADSDFWCDFHQYLQVMGKAKSNECALHKGFTGGRYLCAYISKKTIGKAHNCLEVCRIKCRNI